jgi:hypothetical protein
MTHEQKDAPRPHGDPLEESMSRGPTEDLVHNNAEENRAQRQSDAQPDATVGNRQVDEPSERSDRAGGRGSDANGVTAFDEADGDRRRTQYEDGAELVSRID